MTVATLMPYPDFGPVPRIAVTLAGVLTFDGGFSGDTPGEFLDGGGAEGASSLVDGGTAGVITFDVPPGTDRVTLWRRCRGRSMKVRGAVKRPWAGSLAVLDMEAPLNEESLYELECFEGDVSVARFVAGRATLGWDEPDWVMVVQQPLSPHLCARVEASGVSVPEVERAGRVDLVDRVGRSNPVVIARGPVTGVRGARLDLVATSREVASAVAATLGTEDAPQVPVWCVRGTHPLLPPVFFGAVQSLIETGLDLHVGGVQSTFSTVLDEVESPAPALVSAVLGYSDLAAVFPTYSALKEALPRYSLMASAWEYAGAAG